MEVQSVSGLNNYKLIKTGNSSVPSAYIMNKSYTEDTSVDSKTLALNTAENIKNNIEKQKYEAKIAQIDNEINKFKELSGNGHSLFSKAFEPIINDLESKKAELQQQCSSFSAYA